MSKHGPSFSQLREIIQDTYDDQVALAELDAKSRRRIQNSLPSEFTWSDVAREFARREDLGKPQRLRALCACLLAARDRLRSGDGGVAAEEDDEEDAEAKARICAFVARCIAPIVASGDHHEEDDEGKEGEDDGGRKDADSSDQARNLTVRRCRAMAGDGLAVLDEGVRSWGVDLAPQGLFTVVALADRRRPWTTEPAASLASEMLGRQFAGGRGRQDFIVGALLEGYLRPLFSRARPATVTASGRKAEYVDGSDGRRGDFELETAQGKPWKYEDLRAISVLRWALGESEEDTITSHWALFTPVILTLLDDPSTEVRRSGLTILGAFLDKIPAKTLQNTGLLSVFEDAVFPTLLFLPSLTPEDESVQLLEPAFAALIQLAGLEASIGQRERLLDKVLRDGAFAAFFHSREHVRIVEVIARHTASVVIAMGIHAVKHLKDLIPMFSEIMTDPLAMSYPATLASAIKALQATIATCWPRLSNAPWQEEIIRVLVVAWLTVHENDQDSQGLEAELTETAEALSAVMRASNVDVAAQIDPLVAKEPQLRGLFGEAVSG